MDDDRVSAATAIQPSFAHRAEYAALRGAVAAMGRLSFARAGALGERIGRLGYRPLGIRRAVVERQLIAAFPDRDREDIDRITRGSYAHLGRTSVETAILPAHSPAQIVDLFEDVQGWDMVEERLARGNGLIVRFSGTPAPLTSL